MNLAEEALLENLLLKTQAITMLTEALRYLSAITEDHETRLKVMKDFMEGVNERLQAQEQNQDRMGALLNSYDERITRMETRLAVIEDYFLGDDVYEDNEIPY